MASIRKKLSMALGLNTEGSSSTRKSNSVDKERSSIDSGYYNMIAKPKRGNQGGLGQTTTFMDSGPETSPKRSPRVLHKTVSTTFSGAMQAFSNTVRSTTSYIYPTAGEPDLPSSEWAECETPKKHSHRSSIMCSVRSRRLRLSPRSRVDKSESPELPKSSMPAIQEKAPALEVKIPDSVLSHESLKKSSTAGGSPLLADVKLPAAVRKLWPGPTRIHGEQASGDDRRGTMHLGPSSLSDPYVEQGDGPQHCLPLVTSELHLESSSPETSERYLRDDKGYFSEVESNADVSESDGLVPACPNYVAPSSPQARTSSPCRHKNPAASYIHVTSSTSPCQWNIPSRMSSIKPLGSKSSKSKALDSTAGQRASPYPRIRTSSQHYASLEDALNALLPSYEDAMTSNWRSVYKDLSSDVYDADAESLEPSMGSRAAWECHRADRERRYMEIIDMAPKTESDEEVGPELELKRSPSTKPVHYAEELVYRTVNVEGSESTPRHPTGDLHYAVEAIERLALPVGDLAYAVEAIERPPVTTFDPLETVFQQRPMLRLSDEIDEHETLQISDPQELSPSCMEYPSSPPADLSPSRVELPSSPEPCPVDIPAAPKYTMMTMRFTDQDFTTFGVGNLDSRTTSRFSCDSADGSANSSPEKQSCAAPENANEAGLDPGNSKIPTSSSRLRPEGEEAYEADLRAVGIFMPACLSKEAQARPAMDNSYEGDLKSASPFTPIVKETGHGTYREQVEDVITLPNLRSRDGTPFKHSRTVSAISDNADDSCVITTHSPTCNAPPSSPVLDVRSEPASRVPSVLDLLASHGDEQIRIVEPVNAGVMSSLPSPFDGPRNPTDEVGLKLIPSKALECANSLEQYAQEKRLEQNDLESPSPGTMSAIQSSSNSNTPEETFNSATSPKLVSPALIASRKARRKLKKSSSGIKTVQSAHITMEPGNMTLEPDSNRSKLELNKNGDFDKTQKSLSESARTAGGGVQEKSSPDLQFGRKKQHSRDQSMLGEATEIVGNSVRWSDSSSKLKSSKKSPRGKGQAAATLPVTPSPPRTKIPRAIDKASCDGIRDNAGSAVKDSKSRPDHFELLMDDSPLDVNGSVGSTTSACQGDSVLQADPFVYDRHQLNEDLQQDSDNKAAYFAAGHETIGNDSESDKDTPRALFQKKNDKSPPEAEKKLALQRELEQKSDRACTRLAGKLKIGALGDYHVRLDDSAHKDGRPPWRR